MAKNPGYEAYMKSAAWRRRRNRAVKRAGDRCEYVDSQGKRCWAHARLHVHHLHYRNFGHERAVDLQVLCEEHHALEELLKLVCSQCGCRIFSDTGAAAYHWKVCRRKHPKDWADAMAAAKALACCQTCTRKQN